MSTNFGFCLINQYSCFPNMIIVSPIWSLFPLWFGICGENPHIHEKFSFRSACYCNVSTFSQLEFRTMNVLLSVTG